MLFPSEVFLFVFLPVVLGVYYLLLRKTKHLKNIFLLAASLFFYAWGEPQNVWLMVGVILFNWFFGILVDKVRDHKVPVRILMTVMVLTNVGILGWYKYSEFVMLQVNRFLHTEFTVPDVTLPIGISFFTFQAMSYVIDVYRGHGKVQKNPLQVGLYISLFPQLIAGPIVRYETIADQIENRVENLADFNAGVTRFCIGLGKKVLIANNMALIADNAFGLIINNEFQASVGMAWLGAIAYTLQIFFDFSGYSDMAIGLGQMFGFHFEENFKYPYISATVSEFWRRWHISLQTWFRDYVYFPLGGSRVSKPRLVLNLFVVWALTGIWHGANWNFICWGLYYFVLLVIEKNFLMKYLKKGKVWPHIYTLFLVVLGWGLFTCNAPGAPLGLLLSRLFIPQGGVSALYFLRNYAVLLVVCCVCSTQLPGRFWQWCKGKAPLRAALCGICFVLCTAYVVAATGSTALYANF